MTPDEFTNQEFFLDVGNGHQLYVHDWGKQSAKLPIIFLHGGPGSGCFDRNKQRFVPEKQRLIFYDQRGAGKSLPKGSIEHNTTQHLVEDIEKLVKHLGLKKFVITGGSWGSTLALAYALQYPSKLEAMVLSGIYTASQAETEYLDKGGFQKFFPDVWERYTARVPKEYAHDPSAYHYQQAFGDDPDAAKKSIYAYSELKGPLLSLDDRHTEESFDEFDPNNMKIELHYLKNACFLPERFILKNAHKLKLPIWLVQGRYDMVCPPITAYELSKALPDSQLIWTIAGHGNDRPSYDVVRALLLQIAGEQ